MFLGISDGGATWKMESKRTKSCTRSAVPSREGNQQVRYIPCLNYPAYNDVKPSGQPLLFVNSGFYTPEYAIARTNRGYWHLLFGPKYAV